MSALAGKIREVGKSATRKLRSDEAMPAVIYGLKDSVNVVVNPKELQKLLLEKGRNALVELDIEGDANRSVVLKEYQSHPLKAGWLHADFLEVDVTKKIKVKVPVYLVGVAPGEKQGGIVNHILRKLEVESIPQNIPEKIEVPMGEIQLNQVLHVSDLTVGENITVISLPTEMVVTVYAEKVKEQAVSEEEDDAAAPAEDAGKKEDS